MKRKFNAGRRQNSTSSTRPTAAAISAPAHRNFPRGDFETVNPIWLLKAAGLTLLLAATLSYVSICIYVGYSAWRNLLRPTAEIARTPSEPYTPVQFDSAATGAPRLTAWWIPAEASSGSASPSIPTLLFLHSGDGSLGSNVATLDELHQAGVNIFAIDYRGYGQSQGPHPTEQRMLEDSSAAFDYLVNTRHIPAASIVPYGSGLGAVLAATLVHDHAELPAVAIDNPWPNAAEHVLQDPRYRWIPISFLFSDRFDLEAPLNATEKPKLLISGGPGEAESRHSLPAMRADTYDATRRLEAYFGSTTEPKMIVSLIRAHAHEHAAAQATDTVRTTPE